MADRVPEAWRGARWAVPPRAVGAGVAVVVVLAAGAAARVLMLPAAESVPARAAPAAVPAAVPAAPPPAGPSDLPSAPGSPGSPAATSPAELVVDVAGRVRSPGVVRLPAGSRVLDAIEKAGGATRSADLSAVNLARPLVDGEQVFVPRPGQPIPAAAPAGAAGGTVPGAAAAPVDLNSATLADLDALPGIGPVLAQRILDLRQQRGRFTQVDELTDVAGIGDRVLSRLRPLVRV